MISSSLRAVVVTAVTLWSSVQLDGRSSLVAVVDAQRFMDFKQPCKPFSCASKDLQPAPKKDFVFTANGCGTAMLPISADVDFADCCNWHDACYSTCGMKKAACEKRLDKCMSQKCELIGDAAEKDKCKSTAKLFSFGAQMIACPAFQDAQRDACHCVPKEQVDVANKERLVHFLKQSDASKKELDPAAIDKLLAKYSGQEPKMFLRLLLKYPHALKMDKKKANFMEDIFKAGGGGVDMPSFPKATNREKKPKRDEEDDTVDEHIEL